MYSKFVRYYKRLDTDLTAAIDKQAASGRTLNRWQCQEFRDRLNYAYERLRWATAFQKLDGLQSRELFIRHDDLKRKMNRALSRPAKSKAVYQFRYQFKNRAS